MHAGRVVVVVRAESQARHLLLVVGGRDILRDRTGEWLRAGGVPVWVAIPYVRPSRICYPVLIDVHLALLTLERAGRAVPGDRLVVLDRLTLGRKCSAELAAAVRRAAEIIGLPRLEIARGVE